VANSRLQGVSTVAESIDLLAAMPTVAGATDAARQACTRLRWHEALRRRIPQAAAESRVRGARASAALDGAEMNLALVRDLMRGATAWPPHPDPLEAVLQGAVKATAETEHIRALVVTAPSQALARVHAAAAGHLLPESQVGRPRQAGEVSREFSDLGPSPDESVVRERLSGILELLLCAKDSPAVVVAALVHAEIATVRPFVRGNGLVARAMERAIIQASGLDPTGVAVVELGHRASGAGGAAYLGALAAYASGSKQGVVLWITQCAEAIVAGAEEGGRIADAVLAGRLT
jgi:Fic family protein